MGVEWKVEKREEKIPYQLVKPTLEQTGAESVKEEEERERKQEERRSNWYWGLGMGPNSCLLSLHHPPPVCTYVHTYICMYVCMHYASTPFTLLSLAVCIE
jgi:hypothetical protein